MIKRRSKYSVGGHAYEFDDFEVVHKGETYLTSGNLYIEFEAKFSDGEWVIDWIPEGINDLLVYNDDGDFPDIANDRMFKVNLTRLVSSKYEDDIELELISKVESDE